MALGYSSLVCGDGSGVIMLPGNGLTIVRNLRNFLITRSSGMLLVYGGSRRRTVHGCIGSTRVGLKRSCV